jgi:membrane-associated phospholipid phosphatase
MNTSRNDRVSGITATQWMAAVSLLFMAAYWASNQLTSLRSGIGHGVFDWEHKIPFLAWTIVPYLSIGAFFVLSFYVGRNRQDLVRHIECLLLALLVAILCYAAFPLRFTFERPPLTGVLGALFHALASFDLPYNRAPSLHISVLLILWVRFLAVLTGWLRVALHSWFALIGVSVLTTYQHHLIDVPAGVLVGGLCIAWTARRNRASASHSASGFVAARLTVAARQAGLFSTRRATAHEPFAHSATGGR